MIKQIKYFPLFLIFLTTGFSQTLCPPAFLTASAGNTEVDLSWFSPDTAYYGDVLLSECFPSCDSAITVFTVLNDVDNGNGGWFRNAAGDTSSCGTGMRPCSDGGDDNYGAVAVYSAAATPIDSRLITEHLDLTSYSTATLEFVEGYTYSEDAWDSNMVEISTDSGATWNVVHSSNPWDVGNTIVATTVDISSYAGQSFQIAFRYFDATGYGEAWFVDNIRVWGGNGTRSATHTSVKELGNVLTLGKKGNTPQYTTSFFSNMTSNAPYDARTSPCGTFLTYNIYANGSLIASTTETEYTATGLTNYTEYCFNITADYTEGESDTSFSACATPLSFFIVSPVDVNINVGVDEYYETTVVVANHDTTTLDFSVFNMELLNLEVASELFDENFNLGILGNMYNSDGLWQTGDSGSATSIYVEYPEWDGFFAYYNDDAIGSGGDATNTMLATNVIVLSGDEKVYLMMDMFYPQLGGHCGDPNGVPGEWDHAEIVYSTNGGGSWTFLDSNFVNPSGWTKLLYNLTPHVAGQSIVQIGVLFNDCGGAWGYGIGVDNVAIKQGGDFSWLTVSPYEGKIGIGDTVNMAIGAYGVYDGFSANETIEITATPHDADINVNMTVGDVGLDLPAGIPGFFALHQNYPNPFNPVTSIRFDIPELSFARMDIYNILGQRVRTLFHDAVEPGYHMAQWDGKNDIGEELPSGMYMYRLHAGTYIAMEKLILLKQYKK